MAAEWAGSAASVMCCVDDGAGVGMNLCLYGL